MNKEAMRQALEAQEHMKLSRDYARLPGYPLSDADRQMEKSTATLREALAKQPAQQEPEMVAAFRSSHAYTVGFQDGKTQAQQEQVTHAVIAGALFDFMGWLTTRKERLLLSSSDDASPAVAVITEFAKMRKLSLDDAKVTDWNATLQPPPEQCRTDGRCQYAIDVGTEGWGRCPKGKCVMPAQQEPVAWYVHREGTFSSDYYRDKDLANFIAKEIAQEDPRSKVEVVPLYTKRPWVGLTDEELFGLTDEMYSFARHIEAKLKEKNA